ncbi:hypothetical protein QX776_02805 [Alteromonadaceae bacterium BrNp21-10]|nr:hypothetical protein [Alteromonadaceae bacterium BrNp21-10]
MFWMFFIVGCLLMRFGIKSTLRYNRVKKENKGLGNSLRGMNYPESILSISNIIVRGLRKFLWQSSTDGTWQHGVFSVVIFYIGLGLLILGVVLYPETASVFGKSAT